MRQIVVVLLLFVSLASQAVDIKVRLFSTISFSEVTVIPDTGAYFLVALDKRLKTVDTILDIFSEEGQRNLKFSKVGNRVLVKKADEDLGRYDALVVVSKHPDKEFRIIAKGKYRVYHGDLRLRVFDGSLQVVNIVDLEDYVGGVVESEGGKDLHPEYFKAQAVLARTFALKNWNKHARDGYNLKDDVSSQVYFSKAHYTHKEAILAAVNSTKDTLLVTHICDPVLGVFHANSGGCTVGADHAWQNSIEYLVSRPDSFSVGIGSYEWEKEVSKDEFYGYLSRKMGVSNDLRFQKAVLNFDQKGERQAYFRYAGKKLKLTAIRHKFRLRSTYFHIAEVRGNKLLLKGNGYGHGVGLSQDGAMEMDRRGYNYREILHFYFSQTELESLQNLNVE
mgnify:CR=1 FL=1